MEAWSSGVAARATTATVALSPEPLTIGSGQGMAQLHLQRMDFSGIAQPGRAPDSSARQPESMQVDSTSAADAANASSSSAQPAAASGAASQSEAGPSGVQPGASYDATMSDPPQRKPPRKHSDAPMRKLSVSLIDTYKLINQVRARAGGLTMLAGPSKSDGAKIGGALLALNAVDGEEAANDRRA